MNIDCQSMPPDQSLPRLCFVHIPKTAGTSVTKVLSDLYANATFPAMTTLGYAHVSDSELENYRFFKGHAYRRDYQRLPSDTLLFTILRDPVERAISCYNYFREMHINDNMDHYHKDAVITAQKYDIINFIYSASPVIVEHIRLGQLRQFLSDATLSAVGHRQSLSNSLKDQIMEDFFSQMQKMAYITTVDFLELSFNKFLKEASVPLVVERFPFLNTSKRSKVSSLLDVHRAVADVNDVEILCYNLAQKQIIQKLI
jgi:Sulfotransferase family